MGVLILAALLAVSPQDLPGQDSVTSGRELGAWAALSIGNAQLVGGTKGRSALFLGLRYGKRLHTGRSLSLLYVVDILPFQVFRQPAFVPCFADGIEYRCEEGRESVFGLGLRPLGIRAEFRGQHRVRPFLAGSVGLLVSARPIPVDSIGASRLNFSVEVQTGVYLYSRSQRSALLLGYQYLHISNGYLARLNPGVDFHVLYAGYSLFR